MLKVKVKPFHVVPFSSCQVEVMSDSWLSGLSTDGGDINFQKVENTSS
jgi:hypothetical protein